MRKFTGLLFLILIAFAVYWFVFKPKSKGSDSPKLAPITLKTHSDNFNNSVDSMMAAYLEIKNAFVDADTAKAKLHTKLFISLLDSLQIQELKKDATGILETAQSNVNDIKANAQSLLEQSNITEMRKDFSMVTDMLYPSFFRTINYEGPNLYLQNCPMAFGDDQQANWISNSNEIVNPYLGKFDPQYKASMLHCGEVKDTIKAK